MEQGLTYSLECRETVRVVSFLQKSRTWRGGGSRRVGAGGGGLCSLGEGLVTHPLEG